jgi:diguanylate cyclase (GGDEF)-like protein
VTLRGRLATAFLVVVLGPVLLGSFFVGMTVATVSRDRTDERLDHAVTTVRTAIGALCRQLQAVADAVAVLPGDGRRAAVDQLVQRGLASTITISGSADPNWRDCGVAAPGGGASAIAATARAGDVTVRAAIALDTGFIERLAASSGVDVSLDPAAGPAAGADATPKPGPEGGPKPGPQGGPKPGREGGPEAGPEAGAKAGVRGPVVTPGKAAVRRVPVGVGQPLPLIVSTPTTRPTGLLITLVGVVCMVAVCALLVAWWLARSTTRPLADLAWAVDRVGEGDLDTRLPVLRNDELGRLAATFNRMTRRLQAYVSAVTASRDQLRGHLAILGDTLSSTHDLDRILEVILRTALSVTGARGGAVLIVDPETNALVPRCAEGLTGVWEQPDDLRIPLGVGTLGAVAASGEPRRGVCGPAGMAPDEPPCRTYVAVPICAPAVTGDPLVPGGVAATGGARANLGVLALYDRLGTDEFDDTDLLTLRTFAGQAGVAVQNVRVHEEAQRLSLTDPLTGLWNYRCLRESLRREVERASRFGRMLAVLVLDLDHFKEVNDTYGHAAGDAVLSEFARRLRIGLREVDVAFRQGGEEFAVLLPETDGYGGAIVAERLGTAVRELPVLVNTRQQGVEPIPISVSIGIAVYPEHGATAQQLLNAADDALYAAKSAGRDTYRLAEKQFDEAGAGPQPPRQIRGR